MITDWQTNTIYFSELLKTDVRFAKNSKQIFSILDSNNVQYKFLNCTNDIWARDYMPIQINNNEYIEYRYDPDYLQGKWKGCRNLKTYPDIVCDKINLKTTKSNIIMDGGNLVKSSNCVILTEKIVIENRLNYKKSDLIKKIHDTFKVEKVVLIPQDKQDIYGHTDGMLRFIDNETILINHFYKSDSVIKSRLKQTGLKVEVIDYKVKKSDKRNWAYLNFLQTKDLILLPKFNIDEDEQAFNQIINFYPNYKGRILQVEMSEIVKLGGALNCITWTAKE